MLLKSIFEIRLSDQDKSTLLDAERFYRYYLNLGLSEKELRRSLRSLVSEDIYLANTDEKSRYLDLFYVFRRKGEFTEAYKYEKMSGINYIDLYDKMQVDVYDECDEEYYEWRKKNP